MATPLALFGAAPAEGGEGLNGDFLKKHDDAAGAAEKRGDKKTDAIPTEREILGGAKSFEDKKFIE